LWLRIVAALAVVAFFVLFLAGLFGYYDWWLVASIVFAIGFGAVWIYNLFHDPDDAVDMMDE
jgi:hypothetical protein